MCLLFAIRVYSSMKRQTSKDLEAASVQWIYIKSVRKPSSVLRVSIVKGLHVLIWAIQLLDRAHVPSSLKSSFMLAMIILK